MPGFDRATAIGVGDARIGLAPVPFRSQRTMLVSDARYKVGQLVYEVNNNRFVGHAGGGLWIPFGGGGAPLNSLTGDVGGVVLPVANNINVQGGLTGAIQFSSGGPGQLNAAVQVDNTTITIVGGQLTLAGGGGAITFNTNAAPATVAAGVIQILGNAAQGVSTSGAGNIVTITVADATVASKGVASFNTNDFTVAAGAVSLKNQPLPAQYFSLQTIGAVTASTPDITLPNNQVSQVMTNIAYVDNPAVPTVGGGVLLSSAVIEQAGVFTLLNLLDELSINESAALAASDYAYIAGGAASTMRVQVTGVAGFTINWRVAVTIISTP